MRFGLYSKLVAKPGQRDALVAILLRDVEALRTHGCELYVVNLAADNDDAVWVTEVWTSKEAHAASLQLSEAKAAIAEAMPLLTGEFDQVQLAVVGGLGLAAAPAV